MWNKTVAGLCAILITTFSGCGGATSAPSSAGLPAQSTVFLVVLENQSEAVVGNVNAPYLTQLAQSNALAGNYYADTHPSLGNYFMLTTGQIITNDPNFSQLVDVDNLVREMTAAGVSWKAYLESLPSPGFTGYALPYDKDHNPFAFLSDVVNDAGETANMVPYSQLAADMAGHSLPRFVYIKASELHDMHSCPDGTQNCTDDVRIAAGDNWLSSNIPPILDSPVFKAGGVMIITFDESSAGDNANGGGHVATILIGPQVKKGYVGMSFYQHESTLRLIAELLGAAGLPGNAGGAPRMTEFFVGN